MTKTNAHFSSLTIRSVIPKHPQLLHRANLYLQSGLIQLVHDFGPEEFRNNVVALVDVAKYFNAPCILTTSFETGPNGPIVKEIAEALPDAPIIRRPGQINAMDNEDFVEAIKKTGKKQMVLR